MKYLILFLLSFAALADDMTIDISLFSKHFNRSTDEDLNEKNTGVGLTYSTDDYFITAGQYLNSYYAESHYVGGGYKWSGGTKLYTEYRVFAGTVDGYDTRPFVTVLPSVSFGIRKFGKLNIVLAPKVGPARSSALLFAVSLNID